MPISLSINIVHNPAEAIRRSWVMDIRREFPEARVVSDYAHHGCWPTCRRAWKMAGGTHHLALADDMVPPKGARDVLLSALTARPDACICLFTMRRCTVDALAVSKHWAVTPDGVWGGAVVLPTPWVSEWLTWDAGHVRPDYPHDDVRMALWLVKCGREVWHTAPSLFEHVGASYGLHPNSKRVASALLQPGEVIDWSKGLRDPLRDWKKTRSMEAPATWRIIK